MRSTAQRALIGGVIVLAVGHLAYWYLPRHHPRTVDTDGAGAALLTGAELPVRVWIAHPHQNLGFLAHGEGARRWRQGLSRLLGTPEVELPRFGPFAVPPARALTIATDLAGDELAVVAEVFPAVGVVARAAGAVAANPWLEGGEVDEGGRRWRVSWTGMSWRLESGGGGHTAITERSDDDRSLVGAALAWLDLSIDVGPLPAGRYRLRRSGEHLDLQSAGDDDAPRRAPVAGGMLRLERPASGGRTAVAILGPGEGSLRGVPSAVVLARGARLPELPFERLYRLLGISRHEASDGGWRIAASDRLALDRGRQLAAELATGPGDARLAYAVDLELVRAVAADLERRLEGVPLPRIDEIERWRGAAQLLAELSAYDRWTFEVDRSGRVRSRLWSGGGAAPGA